MKKSILFFMISFILTVSITTTRSSDILIIKNDNNTSSQQVYDDAVSFGHNVQTIEATAVTYEILTGYDIVILSCGGNLTPVAYTPMRLALTSFSLSGGKILIEGGEVSFASSIYPQNNGFAAKVLRMREWIGHNGGSLSLNNSHSNSLLATVPNELEQSIAVTYNNPGDQDVCQNDLYSEQFYTCSSYPNHNGVIVYPRVNSPQIIFFTFNYASITNSLEGKNLLENCLHRLGNVPIGIQTINTEVPESFKVYPNFPNPFNPETRIRFSLQTGSNVKVTVFDLTGREIERLANEYLNSGTYEVMWNANNSASGIYLALVQSKNASGIIKMTLVK